MYDPEKRREELQQQAITAKDAVACPNDECNDNLRYTVDWEKTLGTLWWVSLRCPNCEEESREVIDEIEIVKLDDVLNAGTDRVVEKLGIVTAENMVAEKIVFVRALNEGHIIPEDF